MPQKAIRHYEIAKSNRNRDRNKAGVNNSTNAVSAKKRDRNDC